MAGPILRVTLCDDGLQTERIETWCFSAAQEVQVGRHDDNDVVLASARVSRFHLTLFCDGKSWHCASFGSNGTYCDGRLVSHVEFSDSLFLELGPPGPKLRFDVIDSERQAGDSRGTLTLLIDKLKTGDTDSFEQLWANCFTTIVRLARQRLGTSRQRMEDEEDVASEVFQKLYLASVQNKLQELTDRQSLWRLLITMTRNTALDSVGRERAAKRGGGLVRGDSIADDAGLAEQVPGPSAFDNFISSAPTPASIASLNELVDQWLRKLPDDESRQIAMFRLEGFNSNEIAARLGLPQRTAERRLQQIRDAWLG